MNLNFNLKHFPYPTYPYRRNILKKAIQLSFLILKRTCCNLYSVQAIRGFEQLCIENYLTLCNIPNESRVVHIF